MRFDENAALVIKYVDERQSGLQTLREEATEVATALNKLSLRMKGLAHDTESTLVAFRQNPPCELATEKLKAERDEAVAEAIKLRAELQEARYYLQVKVRESHSQDATPPNWLARMERDLEARAGVPEYEFYEMVGKKAIRWAKDARLLGKESSDVEHRTDN